MRQLEEADNLMTGITNTPMVRFVERGGVTLIEELGRANPRPPLNAASLWQDTGPE